MNKSYKNVLQEYCQKKKIPLPVYDTSKVYTFRCDVSSFSFVSKVLVSIGGENTQETSDKYNSKKEAESDAARKMYYKISNNQQNFTNQFDFKDLYPKFHNNNSSASIEASRLEGPLTSTAIFIDLENLNKTKEYSYLAQKYSSDDRIILLGFISEYHHLARNDFPFKVIKIKSNRSNACDVGLSMYCSLYLKENPSIGNVIIASRDNFAGACVECINTNLLSLNNQTLKAYNAYDIQNVVEILNNLGYD